MQRRRRLRITPTPGREIPPPDDPGLPDVAPRPEPPPEAPPARPDEPDLPAPVPPRDPRDCLGSVWEEPHLWAVMRAQLDARRRRAAFLATRRPARPIFTPWLVP